MKVFHIKKIRVVWNRKYFEYFPHKVISPKEFLQIFSREIRKISSTKIVVIWKQTVMPSEHCLLTREKAVPN